MAASAEAPRAKKQEETRPRAIKYLKKDQQYVDCPMPQAGITKLEECMKVCLHFRGLSFTHVNCAFIKEDERHGSGERQETKEDKESNQEG